MPKNIFESDEYLNEEVDTSLMHYGTPRHSGRYPWGSGKNPQRGKDINARAHELKKKGYSEREVASIMGYKTVNELRAAVSIGAAARDAAELAYIQKLHDKGMSNSEIGRKLGINESSVRSKLKRLAEGGGSRTQKILDTTTGILKDFVDKSGEYLDVGKGTELYLNISDSNKKTALEILKKQGYEVISNVPQEQLGTGHETKLMVLAPKGTTWGEVMQNKDKIHAIQETGSFVDNNGDVPKRKVLHDPVSVSKDRVYVRYDEEGGTEKDGTIELRRGVADLDLGHSNYAQVRIRVGKDEYMKGMAFYSDDIPDGYDMIYNSNKKRDEADKVFKKMDPAKGEKLVDQFGALIDRQNDYTDPDGKEHKGALNIIREEGSWAEWSKNIASQMLAKQSPNVAKEQLNIDYADREDEFSEIMSLTNPVVKKRLLLPFADECDSASVHLKAASFPRQGWHAILPFPEIKDNEIYAPNYKDGEDVVLIRYPHGGTFEIPELKVNNRYKSAKDAIGSHGIDAVGINKNVADRLSGADFDGDTVLVIPNPDGKLRSSSPLKQLEGFDTKRDYPGPNKGLAIDGRPKVGEPGNAFDTQKQMGMASNLITDMTIGGATPDELARAVKHSMVVIDAKKHNLDWKRSFVENGIQELKNKYQPKGEGKPGGGVSTLLSRAKSPEEVMDRKLALTKKDPKTGEYLVKEGINVKTGEKVYEETGYMRKTYDKKTDTWTEVPKTMSSTKMAETSDARELMSGPNHEGTPIERIYADYANRCKALGNKARKAYLEVDVPRADPQATKEYAPEVASLKSKLIQAQKNAPLERLAHVRGGEIIKAMKRSGEFDHYSGADWKKEKGKALERARRDVGAKKQPVEITDREWEAIQARAVSPSLLKEILDNANLDAIKQRAMPKKETIIGKSTENRIKAYAAAGRSQAEIAEALGISVSTVSKILA